MRVVLDAEPTASLDGSLAALKVSISDCKLLRLPFCVQASQESATGQKSSSRAALGQERHLHTSSCPLQDARSPSGLRDHL